MKKLFFLFNLLFVLLVFTFTSNATRQDNGKSFLDSVKRAYENTDKLHGKSKKNDRSSSHEIYTIQTGSFINIERAHEKFESLIQGLKKKESDHLRIEKIGKYYTVRIGNFEDYASVKKALKAFKSRIPEAVILKAYIKKERIKMIKNGKNKKIRRKRNEVIEKEIRNKTDMDFHYSVRKPHIHDYDADTVNDISYTVVTPVPEPSTLLFIGSGLIGLGAFRKKFKKK